MGGVTGHGMGLKEKYTHFHLTAKWKIKQYEHAWFKQFFIKCDLQQK